MRLSESFLFSLGVGKESETKSIFRRVENGHMTSRAHYTTSTITSQMSLPAANASSSTSSLDVIRPLSRDPISKKLKRQRETYSLQVRAFLDAADEVDIDQDVATDILEGFEGDINDDEGNEVDVEADGELSTNTAIYSEDDDDNDNGWKVGDDDEDPESDAQEEEGGLTVNLWHINAGAPLASRKHAQPHQ